MKTKKIFKLLFVIYTLLYLQVSYADIPKKFIGEWSISYIPQEGFPWWRQIKYPVKLFISSNSLQIIDQFGHKCKIKKFIYDTEFDILVFSHCGEAKSNRAFEIINITRVDSQGKLYGEVKSYKTRFRWSGELEK